LLHVCTIVSDGKLKNKADMVLACNFLLSYG
jgi:hypothetical protein